MERLRKLLELQLSLKQMVGPAVSVLKKQSRGKVSKDQINQAATKLMDLAAPGVTLPDLVKAIETEFSDTTKIRQDLKGIMLEAQKITQKKWALEDKLEKVLKRMKHLKIDSIDVEGTMVQSSEWAPDLIGNFMA